MQTQEWGEGTQAILEQARHALLESEQQAVRDLAGRLPEDHSSSDDAPISLALAGQYSAGKSTILRALTGRQDIATGAGITTEQTLTLDWNGVRLIDTPGIHTSIRPDHDAVTYDAISQADLLVFVITNELFDDHLGSHFRKLVIDREKGHETILVVNKMGRAADGNTPEARGVIVEDLREPLAPLTPEGLRTTFTDAESTLEAREEEEDDLAGMLRRQANMEELVRNLDDLIRDRGLNARHTTTLYTIDQVMRDAMASEPGEDPDVESLALMYNQNMRVIRETRCRLRQSTRNAIDQAATQVITAGAEYAGNFHPDTSQEQLDGANSSIDARIEEIWNNLIRRIQEEVTGAVPEMGDRLNELHGSHRFRTTIANLNSRRPGPDTTRVLNLARTAAARLGKLGRMTAMSPSRAAGASGLAGFSGSPAHHAVLRLGHTMGHSFKPWGAVKTARNIDRASAALSVLGIALDIGAQIKSERDEARRDAEDTSNRQKIRARYEQVAKEMEDEAQATVDGYIGEYLTGPLEEMQRCVDDLNQARQEQNQHLERLSEVSRQAGDLIAEIHAQEP